MSNDVYAYNEDCHSALCNYEEPHKHGFACGMKCICRWSQVEVDRIKKRAKDLHDSIAPLFD